MQRRLVFAGLMASVLMFASCGDSTDPQAIDGTMHANIVGSSDPWDADKALSARLTNGNLVITGTENSSLSITLTVYDAAVGTFTARAGDAVPAAEAQFGDNRSWNYSSAQFPSGSISVTITELSGTNAKGTFEFLAFPVIADFAGTGSYRLNGGTFDVKIK
jgi:hypothetical protein